jgi:predicted DNA binding CopG/RHH family protein
MGRGTSPRARDIRADSSPSLLEPGVLQYVVMGNTLTVRLPDELLERLRKKSRNTGLPVGRVVRQALETSLDGEGSNPLLEFAGLVKGGPRDVSSRKGYSRK